MAEMERDRNQTIEVIRSLLNIAPTGSLTVSQLRNDYRNMENAQIPFKRFGYNTIEEFLESSGQFVFRKTNEGTKVASKGDKGAGHVKKLISETKTKKRRPSNPLRAVGSCFSGTRHVPRTATAYTNMYANSTNRSTRKAVEEWSHSGRLNNQQRLNHQEPRVYQQQITVMVNSQNENGVTKRAITKSNLEYNKVNTSTEPRPNGTQAKAPITPLSVINGSSSRLHQRLQASQNETQKKIESQPDAAEKNSSQSPESKSNLNIRLSQYQNSSVPASNVNNRMRMAQQLSSDTVDFVQPRNTVEQRSTNMEAALAVHHINVDGLSELDPIEALHKYCELKRYSRPNYKYLRVVATNKVQCHVTVNNAIHSTYPNEYTTDMEAQQNAAKIAFEQIKQNELKEQFSFCMDSPQHMAIKILNCLNENGRFKKDIPEIFKDTYSEMLPENWFNVIRENPQMFNYEEAIADHIIVYPISVQAKSTPSPIENGKNLTTSETKARSVAPDQMILPWKKKNWDLFVTKPVSTDEVWARIIGEEYSDAMDSLMTDIEMELLTDKKVATHLEIGRYYLVEQPECWYRIRLEKIDKHRNCALCLSIDTGEEEWFQIDKIFECNKRFLKLPAQAICFSLYGLEDFAENPNVNQPLEELLIYKTVIAVILTTPEDYTAQLNSKDLEAKIKTELFDTTLIDQDINLNSVILERLSEKTLPPKLQENNSISISHVADNGDIFCHLQTSSDSLHYIEKLIHRLTESGVDNAQYRLASFKDIIKTKFYLVYDESGRKWCRAEIISFADGKMKCKCIDYGQTIYVKDENVYQVDRLSAALGKFPAQAILVRLHDIKHYDANVIARLRALLPAQSKAIAKVIDFKAVPCSVNIFKRMESYGNALCTINDTIIMEQSNLDFEITSNVVTHADTTAPSIQQKGKLNLSEIKPYELPSTSEFFNVYVTMASSPDNFKVRAHQNERQFRDLMNKLQTHCEQCNVKVSEDSLEVGQSYAGRNADGFWYRVIIQNVLPASMILAYNCDFGDISFMSIDNLKPLTKEFREMPQAAITAKLHDVKPYNKDWSTEDCTRFQQLVVGKQFVSEIKEIKNDLTTSDVVLDLMLIDVSTEIDLIISDVLRNEGRAVSA